MGSSQPDDVDLLQVDIDLRLGADFWESWWSAEAECEVLTVLARCAYGRGYTDALTEETRGELCRRHGLPVPRRRPTPSKKSRPE